MTEDSTVIPPAQQQEIARILETDAEVMSNTQLQQRALADEPQEIQDEILAINTDARNRSLQVALCVPLAAALLGLANAVRMTRLPDITPAAPLDGIDLA
jgi:hypothetical protein